MHSSLKKIPALTPTYRNKLGWARQDGDRDRLMEICRYWIQGHTSNLVSILWPLYMMGKEKYREMRGTRAELQGKLKCSMSPKAFNTCLTRLSEAGLIHVDVQCESGGTKKFTRIAVREEVYIMLIGARLPRQMGLYKIDGDRLYVAIRVLQEGERVLGLGKLNRHTAPQRKAIRDILELCATEGLSYGHLTVIDIMDEKFHEMKDETGIRVNLNP